MLNADRLKSLAPRFLASWMHVAFAIVYLRAVSVEVLGTIIGYAASIGMLYYFARHFAWPFGFPGWSCCPQCRSCRSIRSPSIGGGG